MQPIDIVGECYRPWSRPPPSAAFSCETCNTKHLEELLGILIDDRFLQEPFLVRDARLGRKTVERVD